MQYQENAIHIIKCQMMSFFQGKRSRCNIRFGFVSRKSLWCLKVKVHMHHLCSIAQIVICLTRMPLEGLFRLLSYLRIDYANSILISVSISFVHSLQNLIQISAARLISSSSLNREHIKAIWYHLQWLPVEYLSAFYDFSTLHQLSELRHCL